MSVLESIKNPDQVATVSAEDRDAILSDIDKETGYSDVRYALKGENTELFVIDNVTGVIQVSSVYHISSMSVFL